MVKISIKVKIVASPQTRQPDLLHYNVSEYAIRFYIMSVFLRP